MLPREISEKCSKASRISNYFTLHCTKQDEILKRLLDDVNVKYQFYKY